MDKPNNAHMMTRSHATPSEAEKALIVSSLTQLCFRLKSVSRENSLAPQSTTSQKPQSHSSSSLSMMRQKYPESYPPMASSSSKDSIMSKDEAKKALTASCERIASMQNLLVSSSEALATLGKIDAHPGKESSSKKLDIIPLVTVEEPPLLTSSPAFSTFRKQPEQLKLAQDFVEETTEDDEEEKKDEAKEKQTKQRQNLLLSSSYFTSNNNPKPSSDFKPTLTPITSRTATPSLRPKSPNLSTSSKTELAESLNSEATMKGYPSIETDSSKTLIHNDTFDNSEMSDFSYDS